VFQSDPSHAPASKRTNFKQKKEDPPPGRTQKRERTDKDNAFPEKKKNHKYNLYFQA